MTVPWGRIPAESARWQTLFIFIIIFTALLFRALPLHAQGQGTPAADLLGVEWNGREEGRGDFTLVRQASSNVFDHYAITSNNPGGRREGTVTVDRFRAKVKMGKIMSGGKELACDGAFSGDRRFVSGVCYDGTNPVSTGGYAFTWWATVERSERGRQLPYPMNINLATVKELERFLRLDPVTARNIIDHKLNVGVLRDPRDLLGAGIVPEQVFERIRHGVTIK